MTRSRPIAWVPSLYFAMGTPMITVSVVAAIMYKNLGLSNEAIALYTGSMYLPWVIKPLWAPVVEMFRTKRFFVLAMEAAMVATLSAVALSLSLPAYLWASLAFLWVTGFASATQDIAADGVYISSMSPKEQAAFAGVQGICWNIGRILAAGVLVSFTGLLHGRLGLGWPRAWAVIMLVLAGIMALAFVWHLKVLPSGGPAADAPKSPRDAARVFGDAFTTFFKKKSIWLMLAVVFFYRFGEGFIEKIGPLFLLDARETGGLGLDNVALGNINGTFGTVGFIGGALLGGGLAAKMGLRRSFLILAFALNIPHLTYFFLSQALPTSLTLVTVVVTLEKVGYGLGSVGHMLYMMQQLAPGRYKTAHYAFATGIMGLCMMSTGMASGYVQHALGYQGFFIFVLCASVPPIALASMAPFHVRAGQDEAEAVEGAGAAPVAERG
jgi:MFS transporter, PAT family, beta-lactamase induction signal transducer AmpG